jgi:hypothetical protein
VERQAVSRLILFGAIMVLVTLGATGNASPVLALAIGIPAGFVAAVIFLLSWPFIAVRVAEHEPL